MSLHADLLEQARHLARREPRRPTQVSLRRAVSAAYYALFHLLTSEASGIFVRDYALLGLINRTFDHAEMSKVSLNFAQGKLPSKLNGIVPIPTQLRDVAKTFVDLQQARHDADYNLGRTFLRHDVLNYVSLVEQAFRDWNAVRDHDIAGLYLGCFSLWDRWEKKIR